MDFRIILKDHLPTKTEDSLPTNLSDKLFKFLKKFSKTGFQPSMRIFQRSASNQKLWILIFKDDLTTKIWDFVEFLKD